MIPGWQDEKLHTTPPRHNFPIFHTDKYLIKGLQTFHHAPQKSSKCHDSVNKLITFQENISNSFQVTERTKKKKKKKERKKRNITETTKIVSIPLWIARLSEVNTISECFYQNLRSECAVGRLTRVFARRTRRFVKPRDCRRYIRLAKAQIRLLMCRLRVCGLIRLFVQVLL